MIREPDRASRALPSQARATHDRATSCRTCHEGTSVARVGVKDEGASLSTLSGRGSCPGIETLRARGPHATDSWRDPHDGLTLLRAGRGPMTRDGGGPYATQSSPLTHCMYRSGSALRAGPRSPTVESWTD